MSKKLLVLIAMILVSFVYGCSTQQNNSDLQCSDDSSCGLEVTADDGRKIEENNNESDVTIAGDNEDGGITISSSDEEV